LLGVLALLIVLSGALIDLPWLGAVLALVTIPPLAVVLMRSPSNLAPTDNVGKVTGVLATAGAVLGVIVAGFIAFAAVCLPVGFVGFGMSFEQRDPGLSTIGEILLVAAWPLGIAAALFVAVLLRRRLWPKPARSR
jgi:hypothetical protein